MYGDMYGVLLAFVPDALVDSDRGSVAQCTEYGVRNQTRRRRGYYTLHLLPSPTDLAKTTRYTVHSISPVVTLQN